MKHLNKLCAALAILAIGASSQAIANDHEPPSPEEMWKIIQQQQSEIATLKNQIEGTAEAVEATAQAVEEGASSSAGWWNKTSLGGYGEAHLETGTADQVDAHRYVLFVGH